MYLCARTSGGSADDLLADDAALAVAFPLAEVFVGNGPERVGRACQLLGPLLQAGIDPTAQQSAGLLAALAGLLKRQSRKGAEGQQVLFFGAGAPVLPAPELRAEGWISMNWPAKLDIR